LTQIIGIGAGGHAKVVIDAIQLDGRFELIGLLDARQEMSGETVLGVPILGDDSLLSDLYDKGVRHAFIGLGGASDTQPRERLYCKVTSMGFEVAIIIHPKAIISPSAQTGPGLQVLAGAIINASAVLGENVLINTGAIVEHDCVIEDHAHIATGARLASTVRVGRGAHVGAGATVRQSITIGEGSIVGAGAVVVRDVPARTVVVGVPARTLRTIQPGNIDAK